MSQGQICRRGVEIAAGGGFDAVEIVSPVDLVEVHLQDLVFLEDLLHPYRQDRFRHLAAQGPIGCQKQVLDQLHGDGGSPPSGSQPSLQTAHDGAGQANGINALMGIEVAVFIG